MLKFFLQFRSLTKVAVIPLMVVFSACSMTANSIDDFLDKGLYEEALASLNKQLEDEPDQVDLSIQKGKLLIEIALKSNAADRANYYKEAVDLFFQSEIDSFNDVQINQIENMLHNAWNIEFNAGTGVYKNSSESEQFKLAIVHFDNAIILNNNKFAAYLSKSVVLHNANNTDKAIQVLTEAKELFTDIPHKICEYLGFLHLQNNNKEQAIYYYELAHKYSNLNKNISFGLVNIYILNKEHKKAIELLTELDFETPNNAKIKNTLGTQFSFLSEDILNQIIKNILIHDFTKVDSLKSEATKFSKTAEKQLIKAYELEPTNHEYIHSLAVFYNNLTNQYLSLTEISTTKNGLYYSYNATTFLKSAIKYYEKLTSIVPEDFEISSNYKRLKQVNLGIFNDTK